MPLSDYSELRNCDYKNLILKCEKYLDTTEIVSIVFLMCEDPELALSILLENIIMSLQAKQMLDDLFQILAQCNCQNIHCKFIESLALLGNFKSLELLGYSAKDIKRLRKVCTGEFSPTSVNTVRKELFLMLEKLNYEELSKLINLIRIDFKKNKSYVLDKRYMFMEIYLLFYLSQEYISDGLKSPCDLSRIIELLKVMDRDDLAKRLFNVARNAILVTDNETDHRQDCVARNRRIVSQSTNYPMQEKKGLCVIVNQRDFSRSKVKLDYRHGTNSDRDLLDITFSGLGYEVKIIENADSSKFENSIRSILKNEVQTEHSSFVLCVLSHGKEGVVYCTDGEGIPVKKIQDWMLGHECPQLISKPKVLLLQACQGSIKQRVVPYSGGVNHSCLETDGPVQVAAPLADLLVFNSTIPGYASFRNWFAGSTFIQTVCLSLLNYAEFDLHDAFIEVNNCLNSRQVGGYITTPSVNHTLTKKIKFEVSKKSRKATAIKLFEKYLIDVLIDEYTFYILYLWELSAKNK